VLVRIDLSPMCCPSIGRKLTLVKYGDGLTVPLNWRSQS
jgi:hypothetical protein